LEEREKKKSLPLPIMNLSDIRVFEFLLKQVLSKTNFQEKLSTLKIL